MRQAPIIDDDEPLRDALRAFFEAISFAKGGLTLKEVLRDVEFRLISQAIENSGGVKSRAAKFLGIKRTTLIEKMKKMGIPAYSNSRSPEKAFTDNILQKIRR